MNKPLSQDTQKEIITKYQSGLGSDTIAKDYNIHPNTVLKILKKNDIERRGLRKKVQPTDELKIIESYQQGNSAPKVAEQFNISPTMVLRYLKQHDIQSRSAEECHRIYEINENFFDTINTQEKAYFLGFLYADGGITDTTGNHFVRVELQQEDQDILKKFSHLIFKDEPESHIKETTRTKIYKSEERQYYSSYLTIHSKYMCGKLKELGCGECKSLILTWPEWLIDPELQQHFIRGYYDGDGGLYVTYVKERSATVKIISTLDMCYMMSKIIKKATNTHFSFYNDVEGKDVYTIHTSGNRQIKNFLEWLYKDATIYLNRKYDKYQELLAQIANTNQLIEDGAQGYSKRYLNT